MQTVQHIAKAFGRAAASYEGAATVQRQGAVQLFRLYRSLAVRPADGILLEIGCGTGIASREALRHFPGRESHFTDLAPAMVECCRDHVVPYVRGRALFYSLDGGCIGAVDDCAVVLASMVLQWLRDPTRALDDWMGVLQPRGVILSAHFAAGCFPEWREACERAGYPCSANDLPEGDILENCAERHLSRWKVYSEVFTLYYPSPLGFFRELRALGAATPLAKVEAKGDLRPLLAAWPRHVKGAPVTFHIAYLVGQK